MKRNRNEPRVYNQTLNFVLTGETKRFFFFSPSNNSNYPDHCSPFREISLWRLATLVECSDNFPRSIVTRFDRFVLSLSLSPLFFDRRKRVKNFSTISKILKMKKEEKKKRKNFEQKRPILILTVIRLSLSLVILILMIMLIRKVWGNASTMLIRWIQSVEGNKWLG